MGKLKKGIHGGISGKVGNVVGAYWKDIYYVRSLPKKVNNPRTKSQVKQRTKFTETIELLSTITPFIRVSFREYSSGRLTAFNAATSYNVKHAATEVDDTILLDYSKVLVSRGSLYPASAIKAEMVDDQLHFSWDTTLEENARSTDLVMLVVYNSTKKEAITTLCAAQRSSGITQMLLPPTWLGDIIHPYIAFRSVNGEIVSDSIYLRLHNHNEE